MKKKKQTSSPASLGLQLEVAPPAPGLSQADDDLVDCCFAIFSDETRPGSRPRPMAIFDTLDDAMEWGLQRFKGGSFRLRYERFILLDGAENDPLLEKFV